MIAVFTDLDGTLLDHDTYSFAAALPALAALEARAIPLILASSKTQAEMRPIAATLRLKTPMIVENGAGIVGLGPDEGEGDSVYRRIRAVLATLPLARHFRGFGDWSVEKVARETGLAPEQAALARLRRFSEPGRWTGTEEERLAFTAQLAAHGLTGVQGGRFFTIMPPVSKAQAMRRVAAQLGESRACPVFTVALGDAPNDLAMLKAADLGVIVANPHHEALPVTQRERIGRILRSRLPGPAGWNEAILTFLARQDTGVNKTF